MTDMLLRTCFITERKIVMINICLVLAHRLFGIESFGMLVFFDLNNICLTDLKSLLTLCLYSSFFLHDCRFTGNNA